MKLFSYLIRDGYGRAKVALIGLHLVLIRAAWVKDITIHCD